LEILRPNPAPGRLRHAVFDFDGTLSLVRAGWQQVMADLMVEVLRATPLAQAGDHDEAHLRAQTVAPVFGLAGQPTLVQMQWLVDEVQRRGGALLVAEDYKREYLDRLQQRAPALADLKAGRVPAGQLRVPGALEFISALVARQVTCSIASGSDEHSVREEAAALGFGPLVAEVRGARDDYLDAKRVLIERLTAEHHLMPGELAVFGDGCREMECARAAGGLAVGVASNEAERRGIDQAKRALLIAAGADAIIPDFSRPAALLAYLFPAG
jgi:phosphoglycolate phosphatase